MAVQNNTAPQKRILVIDDDESILDVAELILTRKGYAVLTLQTGILLREVVEYYVPDFNFTGCCNAR